MIVLAVIGWIFCVAIICYLSVSAIFFGFNYLGRYTIGGAENTWIDRTAVIIFMCIVIALWCWIIDTTPFTLTLTPVVK